MFDIVPPFDPLLWSARLVPKGDGVGEDNSLIAENCAAFWVDDWPRLKAYGHKYDRGHALIFGGPLMTGATRLAARAAQRIGAGLVSLVAPEEAWSVYAGALESVIVHKVADVSEASAFAKGPNYDAFLIGPGLGLAEENKVLILTLLAQRKPTVLDADALSLFAAEPALLLDALHAKCVLTPHEGEFARLFGSVVSVEEGKIIRAQKAAASSGAILLLKGAETVIARPDGYTVLNHNAPPWLATAGAGDVLAGMILGLITAGMAPFAAACAGTFVHGALAAAHGPGLIAEDIVHMIPKFLASILD